MKKVLIFCFNLLPKEVKWKIVDLNFFTDKIKFDFKKIRSNILEKESKIIVIGANDGISFDDLIFSIHPLKTNGVFIEPSKHYFSILNENLKDFKKIELLNIAISSKEAILPLFQLNEKGLEKLPDWGRGIGSFLKEHLFKFENVLEDDVIVEFVVGKPFSWLIENYNLGIIDYLQIDTEGYDAEIIKMIDFNNFFSKIIKFEISNLSISDINEVSSILELRGYYLVRMNEDIVAYSKKTNPFLY